MATLRNLRTWMVRDLLRKNVQFRTHTLSTNLEPGEKKLRAVIYTKSNAYHIAATQRRKDKGYLGCISCSRKARPGEDWFRGNDLPDGDLSERTWKAILTGIVRYEAQQIAPERREIPDEGNA